MPSLLFLIQRIPYPPFKGEKVRPLHILHRLRRTHDVHLGCLVDDPHDVQHIPTVQAMCASSHFSRLDRRVARMTCLSGLLTGAPLSVTFYHSRSLARWVERTMREVRPEVVFVFSSNMAPYILDRRGDERVRIVDLVDVDSEKWRGYAETGSLPMRWVHRREWRRVAALEARIARECDWSVFVSRQEAALFASRVPDFAGRIRGISNGVDHVYFDPDVPRAPAWADAAASEGPHFVFTGTMDYPPNVEAVIWFATAILPSIRDRLPRACFHVVGANPAAQVSALARLPGVFVTGRVPDVRPYLAHATAAVAPMKLGRGIQNKVLEAMAMARPVVLTPQALEGIAAEPGSEVSVAETAEAYADACVTLAGDRTAAEAMGRVARARVLNDFVWEETLRGFDPLLAGAPAP